MSEGFAFHQEAAPMVELGRAGVHIWGMLRSGWAGPRWVVGLSGWHKRAIELACGNGIGLVGGRCGVVEVGSFATLGMTGGGVRGCGVGSGCLRGVGGSWRWGRG